MADNRFFKLIDGSNVFGDVESVPQENGDCQILIKQPYTTLGDGIAPYMIQEMGNAPAAIQIHPMNILWTIPLDEFPDAEKVYKEATSQIITPKSNIIV